MNTLLDQTRAEEPAKLVELTVLSDPAAKNSGLPEEELRRVAAICERAAQGDLEARITHIDPNTEFGRLCQSINHMLDIADSFAREAAAVMESCGNDRFHRPILLRGLKGAYLKSAAIINQAGLKMQKNQRGLAATGRLAAETASNLATVAAACEELDASNTEISRQATESSKQMENAVSQVSHAGEVVRSFSEATRKIESIVTLINKISKQTNLLALNATIEAARAGEHGRGFAVVANEVKELARGSAKATEDIVEQIETMQNKAKEVVSLIKGISTSIHGISEVGGNIANSALEQVKATSDISRSIAEVSNATSEIAENINVVSSAKG